MDFIAAVLARAFTTIAVVTLLALLIAALTRNTPPETILPPLSKWSTLA